MARTRLALGAFCSASCLLIVALVTVCSEWTRRPQGIAVREATESSRRMQTVNYDKALKMAEEAITVYPPTICMLQNASNYDTCQNPNGNVTSTASLRRLQQFTPESPDYCCHCGAGKNMTDSCTCHTHFMQESQFWEYCHLMPDKLRCRCNLKQNAVGILSQSLVASEEPFIALWNAPLMTKAIYFCVYQVLAALLYYLMFVWGVGGILAKQRKAWKSNSYVPVELTGRYLMFGSSKSGDIADRENHRFDPWHGGAGACHGCLTDCSGCSLNQQGECKLAQRMAGPITSILCHNARAATTWWTAGLTPNGRSFFGWVLAWLMTLPCLPVLPIIGMLNRQKFRAKFKLVGFLKEEICCWIFCCFCAINQEARTADQAQGLQTGFCGMVQYLTTPGPCNLILNGRRETAASAIWNPQFMGGCFRGRLVTDSDNLYGSKDFAINAAGKIMLVSRGDVSFYTKTRRAEAAGAVAVVVFGNKDPSEDSTCVMPIDEDTPSPGIPAVYITQDRGRALLELLNQGAVVDVEIQVGLEIEDHFGLEALVANIDEDGVVKSSTKSHCPKFAFLKPGMRVMPGGTLNDIGASSGRMVAAELRVRASEVYCLTHYPMTVIFAPSLDENGEEPWPQQQSMRSSGPREEFCRAGVPSSGGPTPGPAAHVSDEQMTEMYHLLESDSEDMRTA